MANKDDFYLNHARGGYFGGRTLIQASGKIGGHRSVFINIVNGNKSALTYPTFGGVLVNPFKGRAKMYAGDMFEYNPGINDTTNGPTIKALKYYEVAKDVASTAKTILVLRDGYRHIPFVGDNIMVGQDDFATKAKGVTITAVEKTTDSGKDVWKLTVSAALGEITTGKILVEASAAGESVAPMVTNPNTYADKDLDFFYDPNATLADDEDGARYFYTPAIANSDTILNMKKINTLPPAVLALNKSRFDGWFNL